MNDLIHTVEEFRTEERLQCLHGLLLVLLADGTPKTYRAALAGTAGIGGHDDDGVLKVDLSAMGIGDHTII